MNKSTALIAIAAFAALASTAARAESPAAESQYAVTAVRLNLEQIQLVSAGGQVERRVVGLQGA